MERDWKLEATAALSGSGVSKKLCSSHHSAISMSVANHTPWWHFI